MRFYTLKLLCFYLCEISFPELLEHSGVQHSFSNFTEFTLLFSHVKKYGSSLSEISQLFLCPSLSEPSLSFSFHSLIFPTVLNFDALLFNFVSTL